MNNREMEYKRLGFFKRLALGGVAAIGALGSLYCSPNENTRNNIPSQVSVEDKLEQEEKAMHLIGWPRISLNFEPSEGDAPLKVRFRSSITGCGFEGCKNVLYSWDLDNDGIEDSNKQNTSFTYNVGGVFRPKLTVTTIDGLISTAEGLEVIVRGEPKPTPTPEQCVDPYIDTIVSESPGTFYEDTTHVIGAPDWPADTSRGSTLGSPGGNGGWTIFGFTNNAARNINGSGLRFWKAKDDGHGETADVYVSKDGLDFIYIGVIRDNFVRSQDLDFASTGLSEVRYIKVVGTSPDDGVDIDAIEALSDCP